MVDFTQYSQDKPAVHAHVCPTCGARYYPAPMVCPECGTRRDPSGARFAKWETEELAGPCTLLTWTRLSALPVGFEARHIDFGIVEFENGLRAAGQLTVDEPATGMKLEARADVVRSDRSRTVYGLVFSRVAPAPGDSRVRTPGRRLTTGTARS